MEYKKIDIV